jgi:hypothetical protein
MRAGLAKNHPIGMDFALVHDFLATLVAIDAHAGVGDDAFEGKVGQNGAGTFAASPLRFAVNHIGALHQVGPTGKTA